MLFRTLTCAFSSFCCASFALELPIYIISVSYLSVGLFFACLLFFWLVCCACFWFAVFLLLSALTNIVVRVPSEHSHAFFACSSIVYWPTAPISTIHGHRYTPGLVCVSVASVHMCFWPCAHVARSCAYAFDDMFGAYVCVVGGFAVSMHPYSNPK